TVPGADTGTGLDDLVPPCPAEPVVDVSVVVVVTRGVVPHAPPLDLGVACQLFHEELDVQRLQVVDGGAGRAEVHGEGLEVRRGRGVRVLAGGAVAAVHVGRAAVDLEAA